MDVSNRNRWAQAFDQMGLNDGTKQAIEQILEMMPNVGIVTEELSGDETSLDEERYIELTNCPILKYKGNTFVLSTNADILAGYGGAIGFAGGTLYVQSITFDDTGALDGIAGILFYFNNGGYWAMLVEV